MRRAAWLAIALGCAGAHGAAAQALAPDPAATTLADLNNAAFAASSVRLSNRDTLRIDVGADQPFDPNHLAAGARDVDVTLVRSWPRAVSFASDGLAFDIAPHAGFGVSSRGGQAEGGATLTVSPRTRGEQAMARLADMGVKDGALLGDAGRWYLFAAASGRAVGLNMLRGEHGWNRGDWTTDDTGALVGDAQIGVGWRKGDLQSSFGVIHREVKGRHMIFGQLTRDDTVAAFTFSLKPRR